MVSIVFLGDSTAMLLMDNLTFQASLLLIRYVVSLLQDVAFDRGSKLEEHLIARHASFMSNG